MTVRERLLDFLQRHPDKSYTARQLASWLRVTERTVLRHADALIQADLIHEVDEDPRNAPTRFPRQVRGSWVRL